MFWNLHHNLKQHKNQNSFETLFSAPFNTNKPLPNKARYLYYGNGNYMHIQRSLETLKLHMPIEPVFTLFEMRPPPPQKKKKNGMEWNSVFLQLSAINCPQTVWGLSLSILITFNVDWWSVSTIASHYTINWGEEQSDVTSLTSSNL